MDTERKEPEPVTSTESSGDESSDSSKIGAANNSVMDVNNDEDIELKRSEVLEMDCKGFTQREIAQKLGISQPTVCRYLKKAQESVMESRMDYVKQAIGEHHRAKLGQDRALKGLWSIAEDPSTLPGDKLRAYALIIQCNARKSQGATIARNLSQWEEVEDKAERAKEWAGLTDEGILRRAYERQSQHKTNRTGSDSR